VADLRDAGQRDIDLEDGFAMGALADSEGPIREPHARVFVVT
jgi:hypothetical protein